MAKRPRTKALFVEDCPPDLRERLDEIAIAEGVPLRYVVITLLRGALARIDSTSKEAV